MPPKKKGKKSGKGKKGKKGEPEISFQEAVLAYRIGLCEKQIDDAKFEEKNLEEQHERLVERNARLTEEQEQYVKILLKQSREYEKKAGLADKVGKSQVMEALQDKWLASKEEDRRLEEMQAEILNLEKTIAKTKREKAKWLEFKNVGSVELASQIRLLEKELGDMEQSYEEMSEHLAKGLQAAKEKLVYLTEKMLSEHKHAASEQAMETLGKNNRQEVLDNDWLKGELERYQQQCDALEQEVGKVERANLQLMEDFYDGNLEDLKVAKNLFLTQFEADDNLADGGILEVDLSKLSIANNGKVSGKYPVLPAITQGEEGDELQQEGDDYEEDLDEDLDEFLENYYQFNDEDMNEYLQLGPIELKLLALTGEHKPIHRLGGDNSNIIMETDEAPEWPVTQPMLKQLITMRSADETGEE